MRRPTMYRELKPAERAVLYPVFRASLPSLSLIAIGDGLGIGDDPWTDWGPDPNYPDFYYMVNVGDYATQDLSSSDVWTPYGTLRDILVHEVTHVWQYAHGRQVKASSLWAHTPFSDYDFKPGDAWIDYNVEQQASIVEKWEHRGMKKDDELFPYIYGVIWTGGDSDVIRLTLAELKASRSDVPDVPAILDPTPPPRTNVIPASASIDGRLIPILSKRYAANDVAGFGARVKQLEGLFRGLDQLQAIQLLNRLSVRRNGDQASMYFYDNLSTATRVSLLKILRDVGVITV
jgi:hypothetical protein